jgi:hypothetical protein
MFLDREVLMLKKYKIGVIIITLELLLLIIKALCSKVNYIKIEITEGKK